MDSWSFAAIAVPGSLWAFSLQTSILPIPTCESPSRKPSPRRPDTGAPPTPVQLPRVIGISTRSASPGRVAWRASSSFAIALR